MTKPIEDTCKIYCKYYQDIVGRCTFGTSACNSVSNPINEINYTYIPIK